MYDARYPNVRAPPPREVGTRGPLSAAPLGGGEGLASHNGVS